MLHAVTCKWWVQWILHTWAKGAYSPLNLSPRVKIIYIWCNWTFKYTNPSMLHAVTCKWWVQWILHTWDKGAYSPLNLSPGMKIIYIWWNWTLRIYQPLNVTCCDMQMMSPMDPSYLGQGGLLTPQLVSRDEDNLYLMQLNLKNIPTPQCYMLWHANDESNGSFILGTRGLTHPSTCLQGWRYSISDATETLEYTNPSMLGSLTCKWWVQWILHTWDKGAYSPLNLSPGVKIICIWCN